MSDQQPAVIARRRSRGPEATARAGALERLKALRSGGRRSDAGGGYTVKVEDPIYDTVPEEEYGKLVARRREEAQGFIVDDDGLGYGDEGEEEDWSRGGLDYSSDEEEPGEKRQKRKKIEQKEKDGERKRVNPALSAAAEMMGKRRISAMFTSSVFKNRDLSKGKGTDCESIVDDVIAEFAPDEVDRERRRRGIAHLGARKGSGFVPVKVESVGNLVVTEENLDLGNEGCGVDKGSEVVVEVEREEVERDGEEVGLCCLESKESEVKEEMERNGLELREDLGVVVKEEGRKGINAKVTRECGDPALSATAEWQAFTSGGNLVNGGVKEEVITGSSSEEVLGFELDADGLLPFYILDAHEEVFGANIGTVYLFGKVKAGSTYHSCCVVVKNMQRCIYAIPKSSVFCTDEILRLEKDVEEARVSPAAFRKKLQDMAYEVKDEIGRQLVALNVSTFSMTPVKRRYAFERSDIPMGENYVLKINYPFKDPPLAADLKGEKFCAVLGTQCSALELFLVKRKVKGPSWLSVSKFSTCSSSQRVSWCKFEITIDSPKDIWVSPSSKCSIEIPYAVVSAINLKTILNKKQNTNEIVSASLVCCHKAKIDTPMLTSEWKKPGMLSRFTVVCKPDGRIFPVGFTKEATDRNMKAGTCVLVVENSERALLNRLMIEIHKLDSDVLVGHNISRFDLDVLLHRAQACRVSCNLWSKIGRLKRSTMPRLTWGKSSGASPGIMSCIAGRLLCDTDVCSRELLKEVSYSLTQLAKTRLDKDRKEIAPHDIPKMFQTSSSLVELIECGETDAWLSIELMFHLSVLPLTRQLTNISGNLWGKTLQGGKAQRVEYLLLHAFYAKKYIVPDKISYYAKEAKSRKRRMNRGDEDVNYHELDADAANYEDDVPDNDHGKARKGPKYAGGLVLEPKKGLYDKYVLLLDFNSLYPSIIQEYNICFTTVERSQCGLIPQLPSSKITGVLPELLKNLVERRRMVKKWMKTASGLKVQQLDIQQQALKLIANSMYGCLGFENSRFYAKPIAELITLQGREILQSTVDLVLNNMNLEVIYGDTDSIMIYSGVDDITEAKEIAGKVAQEVNKKYRCLEIELDGLYKRMLLQKKKKYAAVKLQFKDGTPDEVIEIKGLDVVRRDWSLLSKELGNYCLSQILSGGSCEDVVESIHNSLMKVQEDMRNGLVELQKYVITKALTKPPEAYTDAKNQPHVLVALRLKQSGYTTGCSSGDTVPYIICCEQGVGSGGSTGIAQRARHPDELVRDDGKWIVDIDYYLSQQILPVVSRLCASIQGTSLERLADCLGLDSSKFQSKLSEADSNDASSSLLFSVDDEERYQNCEPLIILCPSCSSSFKCPSVFSSLCTSIDEKHTAQPVEESTSNFWRQMHCPKCPEEESIGRISPAMIANQVKRQAERFVSTYYKGVMTCDDETCKHTTRRLNLRLMGDSEMGTICPYYPRCNGRLIRKYTEADLYKQLTYFCYLLDTVRCLEKMDAKTRVPLEREFAKVRPATDLALSTIQSIRDRCAYGWVRLDEIAVIV